MTVTLANVGNKVKFRGAGNTNFSNSYNSQYNYFTGTGEVDVSGNIATLFDYNSYDTMTTLVQYGTPRMFSEMTSLVDASGLDIPFTTISQNGCSRMFQDCTNLTKGPIVRATTFNNYSMEYFFYGCSSL